MPRYDYRCEKCGIEFELVHAMSEVVEHAAHLAKNNEACDGHLERLISFVGLSRSVGDKIPSDDKLKSAGFTKYVRGTSGYEKAFGSEGPNFIQRE